MSARICTRECTQGLCFLRAEMQNERMTQTRALRCLNEQVPILLCSKNLSGDSLSERQSKLPFVLVS